MWARAFTATTPEAERLALHEVYDTHPELKDGGLPQNQQYKDNLRSRSSTSCSSARHARRCDIGSSSPPSGT